MGVFYFSWAYTIMSDICIQRHLAGNVLYSTFLTFFLLMSSFLRFKNVCKILFERFYRAAWNADAVLR